MPRRADGELHAAEVDEPGTRQCPGERYFGMRIKMRCWPTLRNEVTHCSSPKHIFCLNYKLSETSDMSVKGHTYDATTNLTAQRSGLLLANTPALCCAPAGYHISSSLELAALQWYCMYALIKVLWFTFRMKGRELKNMGHYSWNQLN